MNGMYTKFTPGDSERIWNSSTYHPIRGSRRSRRRLTFAIDSAKEQIKNYLSKPVRFIFIMEPDQLEQGFLTDISVVIRWSQPLRRVIIQRRMGQSSTLPSHARSDLLVDRDAVWVLTQTMVFFGEFALWLTGRSGQSHRVYPSFFYE